MHQNDSVGNFWKPRKCQIRLMFLQGVKENFRSKFLYISTFWKWLSYRWYFLSNFQLNQAKFWKTSTYVCLDVCQSPQQCSVVNPCWNRKLSESHNLQTNKTSSQNRRTDIWNMLQFWSRRDLDFDCYYDFYAK